MERAEEIADDRGKRRVVLKHGDLRDARRVELASRTGRAYVLDIDVGPLDRDRYPLGEDAGNDRPIWPVHWIADTSGAGVLIDCRDACTGARRIRKRVVDVNRTTKVDQRKDQQCQERQDQRELDERLTFGTFPVRAQAEDRPHQFTVM